MAVVAQGFPRVLAAPRLGGFRQEGYWVWCGAPIRGEDGRYHLFASRWPMTFPFHPGWLSESEVVRAVAERPEGPYAFAEVVLPRRSPEYWDGVATHNPRILRYGDGYVLFYTGMTFPLPLVQPGEAYDGNDPRCIAARASKRIGVATAPSLEGPWTRYDAPVLPAVPRTFYSFLTSNAAPCVLPDGSIFLMFKSRAYVNGTHGSMCIGVARADHPLGPYHVLTDTPLFSPDHLGEIEDPFIWHTGDGFRMIAKDMSGALIGEQGAGIYALSPDGLHWALAPHPQAYSRHITWDDGTTEHTAALERPCLLFHEDRPTHLFAALADHRGHFTTAKATWNQVFPLEG